MCSVVKDARGVEQDGRGCAGCGVITVVWSLFQLCCYNFILAEPFQLPAKRQA